MFYFAMIHDFGNPADFSRWSLRWFKIEMPVCVQKINVLSKSHIILIVGYFDTHNVNFSMFYLPCNCHVP